MEKKSESKIVYRAIFFIWFVMLALIALVINSYAEETKPYENPLSKYRDNYIIAGNTEDQVKFQLSTKFNIIYPSDVGIYFGYTQLTHWYVYAGRDTMYTAYMPEIMYRYESDNNIFGIDIPLIDYIQLSPIQHCSTGVEGVDHRSINTYYAEGQMSYGKVYNVGISGKYFKYYTINKRNADYNDYHLNYETGVFVKIKSGTVSLLDKEELHFKFGGDTFDKGYYIIEARTRLITSVIQPKFFVQFYNGFSQYFVTYNQKDTSLRIGFILD